MQYLHRLAARAEHLAFTADGAGLVAAGAYESVVRQWDLATGKVRFSVRSEGVRTGVSGLAVAPDGRWFAVGYRHSKLVAVWSFAGGPPRLLDGLHGDLGPDGLAFSADGRTLAVGTAAPDAPRWCAVQLWDTATAAVRVALLDGRDIPVGLAFRPDRPELLLVHRERGAVRRIDAASAGEVLPAVPLDGLSGGLFDRFRVTRPCFSPDRSLLAAVRLTVEFLRPRSELVLWDVATGRQRLTLPAHRRGVTGLAFSPDGRLLATIGDDGVVRFWDVATGDEVRAFDWRIGRLFSVAFAPDGMRAAAGGKADVVIWDVDG